VRIPGQADRGYGVMPIGDSEGMLIALGGSEGDASGAGAQGSPEAEEAGQAAPVARSWSTLIPSVGRLRRHAAVSHGSDVPRGNGAGVVHAILNRVLSLPPSLAQFVCPQPQSASRSALATRHPPHHGTDQRRPA